MVKKFTLLASALALTAMQSFAQVPCGTDIDYQRLRKHPVVAAYEAQLEAEIQQNLARINRSMARTTADTFTYNIPIVVHILHDYGSENISDTQIYNTVARWNEVMLKRNADTADVIAPFKPYIGNPRIRFHLATKDPNGNPTKGVTRHATYYTMNGGDFAKLDGWPQNEYINVWVVDRLGGNMSGAAAYARYPAVGGAMPYYDGAMTLVDYFSYDKTMPHEFGHVFNLRHVFGDTNSPGISCGDDFVFDTPPTKGHFSTGCDTLRSLFDTVCAWGYKHTYKNVNGIDSVTIDYPDTTNAQNIMDYTYCSRMFSRGQVERIHATLQSSIAGRNNLYSQGNLTKTGAMDPIPDVMPVADFGVEKSLFSGVFMCASNTNPIVFKNASWNDTITNVAWTFSNGATTPSSSSKTMVSNRFSQPGWVTVTLTATGNNTGSNTITNTQAVYIADDNVVRPEGYWQHFSNMADSAKWPIFNFYHNQFKWEWYEGVGYGDNACLRYHSFDGRTSPANKTGLAGGDYDDIYTEGFDLSNITSDLNLNFYTAGAYKVRKDSAYDYPNFIEDIDSTAGDSLKVYVSNTCGSGWREIATIKGADLLNNPSQSAEFTPTSQNEWRAQTVKIPANALTNKAFFRLRYFPANNSNNLYLDRFTITPFPTEVQEVMGTPNTIKIYPNPTYGACQVAFTASGNGQVAYVVRDITGRVLYQEKNAYPVNTLVQHELPATAFGGPGMYFVTVTIANKTITQKVVVQ